MADPVDHGGGIDAAAAQFGGARADWIDLSTGINPEPYPLPAFPADCWTALPDHGAVAALLNAARTASGACRTGPRSSPPPAPRP